MTIWGAEGLRICKHRGDKGFYRCPFPQRSVNVRELGRGPPEAIRSDLSKNREERRLNSPINDRGMFARK